MDHGRNCPALGAVANDGCTCGLRYRIELQTEREMHNAWRKRAEEAESVPVADILAIVEIAERNEYAPQIGRVKAWLAALSHS